MKISELPHDIKEKALQYQRNAHWVYNKNSDSIWGSFNLDKTIEGQMYWLKLDEQPAFTFKDVERIHKRNYRILIMLLVSVIALFIFTMLLIFN